MPNILMQVNELQDIIIQITADMESMVKEKMLDDLNELMLHRHALLTELIQLYENIEDKKKLQKFLEVIRTRDTDIMQAITKERDEVKQAILKVNKVKEYVNE